MRNRSKIIVEYGTYMLAYFASYIASLAGLYILSGIILVIEAFYLYLRLVRESKKLVELRALFTLAWIGGQGLACLKLSNLQTDWNYLTWICFFLAYIGFGIGYEWKRNEREEEEKEPVRSQEKAERIFLCILAVFLLSSICFVVEISYIGFLPIFASRSLLYSEVHMAGVHSLTLSCILIPAMTVLYKKVCEVRKKARWVFLAVINSMAILIPVLCLSHFQLIFAVSFALITYIMTQKGMSLKMMAKLLAVILPVYVISTLLRHHDLEYIRGIFSMKCSRLPICISQPYMYIANNYDNFNVLVKGLASHSFGLRMLFPLFVLTGLKFYIPRAVSLPILITKPELTTLTLFYDAYYDFGVVGVFLFAILLGKISQKLVDFSKRSENPIACLFYGQFAIYLGFSFFTTWFSNPSTWFWFIVTGLVYAVVGWRRKEREEKEGKER